jgi:hypothetical protein
MALCQELIAWFAGGLELQMAMNLQGILVKLWRGLEEELHLLDLCCGFRFLRKTPFSVWRMSPVLLVLQANCRLQTLCSDSS